MLWRRILLGLGVATVFGCSGVTRLIVRNNGSSVATIRVRSKEEDGNSWSKGQVLTVPAGREISALHWNGRPPAAVEMEATILNRKTVGRWDRSTYPRDMAAGSSMAGYFVVKMTDTDLTLEQPGMWEKLQRNPADTLLPLGGVICLVGCVALAFVLERRSSRKVVAK